MKALAAAGAEITFRVPPASIRLAYPLKKHETAYFGYIHFMALPSAVKSVKEALAHDAKVLRSLILTPAVKLMVREPRPDRSETVPKDKEKPVGAIAEQKPAPEKVMTNEALEKKLEEILK